MGWLDNIEKAQNGQFLKGNLKEQPPEPTWSESLSDGFSDFGTRAMNAVKTFGTSAIGDAVNTISPEAAQNLEKYSFGAIPYTHEQDLVQNRSSNPERWKHRIGDTQDALISVGADALTMGLANKLPGGALARGIRNDATITGSTKGVDFDNIELANNYTDLKKLKVWADKYGYDLPTNIERIGKSELLTDRTFKGIINRHNSFVRGVSTNWKHIEKNNPQILLHLENKGIDYVNNPKEAAEYMATHVPIQTGYGRAGLNAEVFDKGLDGIYTSNSIPTAEGYTYGDGFITTVKKPTDYSAKKRTDWIKDNQIPYTNKKLNNKVNYTVDGEDVSHLYAPWDDWKNNINRIKRGDKKELKEWKKTLIEEITKERDDAASKGFDNMAWQANMQLKQLEKLDITKLKYNFQEALSETTLKTEHMPREKALSRLQHDLAVSPENIDEIAGDYPLRDKITKISNEAGDKYKTWVPGSEGYKNTKLYNEEFYKGVKKIKSPVLQKIIKKYEDRIDYAHYIHLGEPGEKILEAVKSTKVTPDKWKNRSRAHSNVRSEKLSNQMSEGPLEGIPSSMIEKMRKSQEARESIDFVKADLADPETIRRAEAIGVDPELLEQVSKNMEIKASIEDPSHYSSTDLVMNINPNQLGVTNKERLADAMLGTKSPNFSGREIGAHETGHVFQDQNYWKEAYRHVLPPMQAKMLRYSKGVKPDMYKQMLGYYDRYSTRPTAPTSIDEMLSKLKPREGVTDHFGVKNQGYFNNANNHYGTSVDNSIERLPMFREYRQGMRDAGILKNKWDEITPEAIDAFYKLKPENRLNTFMDVTDKGNRTLLKDVGRIAPAFVGGAAAASQTEFKNGGWLDSYQDGGIIEDDRGQWAHPGKVTKINSNNITMKGVNYPVLGISDEGDKQIMYPEGEYTFKGKNVTEIPLKAQSGAIIPKAKKVIKSVGKDVKSEIKNVLTPIKNNINVLTPIKNNINVLTPIKNNIVDIKESVVNTASDVKNEVSQTAQDLYGGATNLQNIGKTYYNKNYPEGIFNIEEIKDVPIIKEIVAINPKDYMYNTLSELPKVCTTKECASALTLNTLKTQGSNILESFNMRGSAWTMLDNVTKRGANMISDIFASPDLPKEYNLSNIKSFIKKNALNENHIKQLNDQLHAGDIVALYWANSPNYKKAFTESGGKALNTHIGEIIDIKGERYVRDNVHGKWNYRKLSDVLQNKDKEGVLITGAAQLKKEEDIADMQNIGISPNTAHPDNPKFDIIHNNASYRSMSTIKNNKTKLMDLYNLDENQFNSLAGLTHGIMYKDSKMGVTENNPEYNFTSGRSPLGKIASAAKSMLEPIGLTDEESVGLGNVKVRGSFSEEEMKDRGYDEILKDKGLKESPEFSGIVTFEKVTKNYNKVRELLKDLPPEIRNNEELITSLVATAHNQGFENIEKNIENYKENKNASELLQYQQFDYPKIVNSIRDYSTYKMKNGGWLDQM